MFLIFDCLPGQKLNYEAELLHSIGHYPLTIATNVMADNPDSRQNAEVDTYSKKNNWNGRMRDEIFDEWHV